MDILSIKISRLVLNDINRNKKSLLYSYSNRWFIIVKDVRYDEKFVTKTKFWTRKKITNTEYYINSATVVVWNIRTNRWTTLNELGIKNFFNENTYENLTTLRWNYLNEIKAPLESLGATFDNKNVNE